MSKAENKRKARAVKRRVFVAHAYDKDQIDDLRSTIEQSLRPMGLLPIYGDQQLVDGHILTDKICPGLRECEFALFEISKWDRPNIYIELGYAFGIGKRCVLLTRSQPPSDLAGFDRIVYSSYLELGEKLSSLLPTFRGVQLPKPTSKKAVGRKRASHRLRASYFKFPKGLKLDRYKSVHFDFTAKGPVPIAEVRFYFEIPGVRFENMDKAVEVLKAREIELAIDHDRENIFVDSFKPLLSTLLTCDQNSIVPIARGFESWIGGVYIERSFKIRAFVPEDSLFTNFSAVIESEDDYCQVRFHRGQKDVTAKVFESDLFKQIDTAIKDSLRLIIPPYDKSLGPDSLSLEVRFIPKKRSSGDWEEEDIWPPVILYRWF